MKSEFSNEICFFTYLFSVHNEKTEKLINSSHMDIGSDEWYVNRDQLYEDLSTHSTLPNDTVKIVCEVKFVTYGQNDFENYASDGDFVSSNISSNKYLKSMFLSDELSDVKLVTRCGKVLKAHKIILASRSQTFAAMFGHDMLENKTNSVEITDVVHEVLKEMLRFIYMGQVENMETVASDLFIAADKYDIQDLKSKCANYIANNINVENAIQIFELAAKYNAGQLKSRAMNFLKSNIAKMKETGAFEEKLQLMGSFSEAIQSLIQ